MNPARSETPTIVVVDRDSERARDVASQLEDAGFRAASVADHEGAQERIAECEPDLVLLGTPPGAEQELEFCRRFKADARTAATPVVMLMGLNRLDDLEKGIEAGADDFLILPVNPLELVTRVKSLVRLRGLRRELEQAQELARSSGG